MSLLCIDSYIHSFIQAISIVPKRCVLYCLHTYTYIDRCELYRAFSELFKALTYAFLALLNQRFPTCVPRERYKCAASECRKSKVFIEKFQWRFQHSSKTF